MKKEDVYLDASTVEKFKEVMVILLSFNEPIFEATMDRYESESLAKRSPFLNFSEGEWIGANSCSSKTLITPKQLGNLLSVEDIIFEEDKEPSRHFTADENLLGALPKRGKTLIHNTVFNPQGHYDNSDGSLFKLASELGLNHWEFDIFKRLVRCRKKDQFEQDLQKIKDTVDIYLREG